jgi:hypothetical protein
MDDQEPTVTPADEMTQDELSASDLEGVAGGVQTLPPSYEKGLPSIDPLTAGDGSSAVDPGITLPPPPGGKK